LAGDAAGFIDPITGDGVRFALRGGELAALTALWMMETGCQDGHERLRRLRATDFSCKWRFNRAVRAVVGSTLGVAAGSMVADLLPGVLRRVVEYAGDTQLCRLSR
jgi:flavin-dependent dehydrogenase